MSSIVAKGERQVPGASISAARELVDCAVITATEKPDGPGFSLWTHLLLGTACGLIIANLYYAQPLTGVIRRATDVATTAVGLITEARQAEEIVASGEADLVALARAMLYDPRWPWHAAAELGATVEVPPPYWRSQPHGQSELFGSDARTGMR